VPALKVPLMVRHLAYGGDAPETVGVVTAARDEERGLWIHAEFFSDDAAQTVRKRIIEARDAGADELYRLSVGYQTVRWDVVEQDGKEIVELFEAKLLDATITVMPCNPDAIITAAKSITDATDVAALRNAVGVLTAMIGDDGTTVPQTPDPGGDAHPEPRRLYTTRAKVLRRRLALTLIGAVGS